VLLTVAVIVVSAVARFVRFPAPILLLVAGLAFSFLPRVPKVELEPDLVLVVLLPPLLYAASIRSSLLDIRRVIRPIVALAVGLVLLTTFAVGFGLNAVVPSVTLAAAMALGAVVAPPDAVAASAVARRTGLDRASLTVLEGESLFNDATALVALSVAVGAATGETETFGGAVVEFIVVAAGGLVVGAVVAAILSLLRRHIHDTLTDSAMSLVAPFAAFIPAEELHVSGVLAVVTTGLILAHRSPRDQDPPARLVEGAVWSTIQFVLEGVVFLLIGLQLRWIVGDVESDLTELFVASIVVLGLVVLVRPAWIFLLAYGARVAPWRSGANPSMGQLAVVSWAGMRGVVSLAAALSLPLTLGRRDLLLFLTVVIIVGTLAGQGLTLPWVIRRFEVEPPDPRLAALQRAKAQERATAAALERLDETAEEEDTPPEVVEMLRKFAELRTSIAWEALAARDAGTPTATFRRLRAEMIEAERETLVSLRDAGELDDEVLREVQQQLDLEYSIMAQAEHTGPEHEGMLEDLIPVLTTPCEHLESAPHDLPVPDHLACPDCVALGWSWVHLRQCLTCGRLGCCDSSRGHHARAHFAGTGHPVMRSVEPGEAWRWCYLDHRVG
jgi:CPA1 family monovalent cation:H+ antiporter